MATMNKIRRKLKGETIANASHNKELAAVARFMVVMSREDMERLKFSADDDFTITVDLHGLGVKDSIVLLNNVINLNRESCNVRVIHGFNHGTDLKDMVNGRFFNPRIIGRSPVANNPGITILNCTAAV